MTRFAKFGFFIAVFAASLSVDKIASADTRRWVEVSVVSTDDDARTLEGSLHELLSRLEIDLEMRHVDQIERSEVGSGSTYAGSPALAVVGVDLTRDPIEIYFRDGKSGKLLGRREVAKNADSSLTVEAAAHIVQSGVEGITSEVPPTPSPTPKPTPPTPPAPDPPIASHGAEPLPVTPPPDRIAKKPSSPPWGIDVGAFCDGSYMASGVGLVVGGGGAASFALKRGNLRPALQISGSYHASFDASDAYVDDAMKLVSLRLVPTLQLFGGESWSVEAGVGAGADTFITSPGSATVPGTFVHHGDTYVDPIATGIVATHFAVAASADLFLSFALPIDLAPHRFLDEVGGEMNSVFLPARVRPAIAFGFEFTAVGRAPYGPRAVHSGTL